MPLILKFKKKPSILFRDIAYVMKLQGKVKKLTKISYSASRGREMAVFRKGLKR